MSSFKTNERINERISSLINKFENCLDFFDAANLFTGPSLYFHYKTLSIKGKHSSVAAILDDDTFFENLYATLTAWGMHRMGPGKAKLVDLDEIKKSFIRQRDNIVEIEHLTLSELEKSDISEVTNKLWKIISELKIGIGNTKIVANSKSLHHLLPNLIPPIDREYTLRYFYNHTNLNQGDEKAFKEIYPYFHILAIAKKQSIHQRLGKGMNTSETKVIDNAIVGYVRQYIKVRENNLIE
jgi:hypothetical protein